MLTVIHRVCRWFNLPMDKQMVHKNRRLSQRLAPRTRGVSQRLLGAERHPMPSLQKRHPFISSMRSMRHWMPSTAPQWPGAAAFSNTVTYWENRGKNMKKSRYLQWTGFRETNSHPFDWNIRGFRFRCSPSKFRQAHCTRRQKCSDGVVPHRLLSDIFTLPF